MNAAGSPLRAGAFLGCGIISRANPLDRAAARFAGGAAKHAESRKCGEAARLLSERRPDTLHFDAPSAAPLLFWN